jgi:hypothetical protein
MTTLVTLGALGLLGTIWFVWGAAVKILRAARRARGPSQPMLAACGIATAGLAASLVFFDALAFVQSMLVFVVVAAIGLRARALEQEAEAEEVVPAARFQPVPAAG